ncbi:DUF3822 family protein [Ichthyenterobacterium sp. W332]|uniref:DUF3822 family protein n=1 Tax=Microcosmobacter mediterraneus TaxID=3075607 RepID=A0ABU2YMG8_9FLAO|nr:DUF3822 family protein [Ichthyenterobacterium sp. W332]MDT0558884.1 DUF3822 family protein [Ichthyenterobacterium sp. W332]
MTTKSIKELSIQVNLNGLSFCILNRTDNLVELLEELPLDSKVTPFKILEILKEFLNTHNLISKQFSELIIIHHNDLSTFVPKELFDEKHSADYLKFNSKILKTDYITHDEIVVNNSVNVYVPYININNYIFETFGEFTYKHASTALVNSILQSSIDTDPLVFLNVNRTTFDFVAISKKELLLYNSFEFYTPQDFIYFVLFTMEQLGLDPNEVNINLSGQINMHDDLYEILYTYVRHIEFVNEFCSYDFNETTCKESLHQHYLVLNSF